MLESRVQTSELRVTRNSSLDVCANPAQPSWTLPNAIPLPVCGVRLAVFVLVFALAGYSRAQGPSLSLPADTSRLSGAMPEGSTPGTGASPTHPAGNPPLEDASPWSRLLGDAMRSGLSAARSGGSSGPLTGGSAGSLRGGGPGMGHAGGGNSLDFLQMAGDLGAGLGAGQKNGFGATMRALPKLSQWLRSGITVPLGSQTASPGEAAHGGQAGGPTQGGGPGGSASGGPMGGPGGEHAQGGGFHLGYQNSLLGAGGNASAGFSGLNAGSASASYEAPRSAGSRFGFSASATAGAETGGGTGASSFGGGGASGGLGMSSSKGSMFGAAGEGGAGGGSMMSAGGMGSGGGMHGGGQQGPVQGVGPGAGGHGGGGSKVGAAVNLKLTF